MIQEPHKKWLQQRQIDPVLAEKLGLESVKRNGAYWLAVPYVERGQTVNHKYRMTSEKKHMMDAGAPLCLWNHDVLLKPEVQNGQQPVVITEGEWDAIVAIQTGFSNTLSVPNGAAKGEQKLDYIERSKELLANVSRFILATDNDEAGRELQYELARRLGPARCSWIDLGQYKDLNEYYLDGGNVTELLNEAKPFPIQGLYRFSELPEPPPLKSITFGIPGLSEHISIVPETLTVFTGYASHGKTSLSMAILANLMKGGMNVAIGSFETMPKPVMQNRLRAALLGCSEYDIPKHDYRAVDALLEERMTVLVQNVAEDEEWDIDHVLDLAAGAVIRDGIRLLFLDPWNEIEHKKRGQESETDYTARALRAIKKFARDYQVAVWIVAHPAKPDANSRNSVPGLYSISGSAHWANKPDYGIVSHRPDTSSNLVDIHVVKVRMGLPGKRGKLTLAYDWRTSQYSNCETGEVE